jgi:hypothetical protein
MTWLISFVQRDTWRCDQYLIDAESETQAREHFFLDYDPEIYVIDSVEAAE